MADPRGFLKYSRENAPRRPVAERIQDWIEVYADFPEERLKQQAARCMDCGIPFCHQGCPLGNIIPDWNDLVYRGRWKEALAELHATNNFPEFTGKLCPAPCESACVLGINQDPVTIKRVEETIALRGWDEGWIVPEPPLFRTGKRVAIVGSGPAGLAAAQQLNRAGHTVTVFERDDRIGGLLRYGIPDFKMEKRFLDRRLQQMEAEGVIFRPGVNVGVDLPAAELRASFDAIVLAGGCTVPRDLPVPGRELDGIHFAMEYLPQQNRRVAGIWPEDRPQITAKDKRVVILGGGDTGADCLGTAHRQGARSVHQFEILPRPPEARDETMPWPLYPMIFRTSSAHEEGGERDWCICTKAFSGSNGRVEKLHAVRVAWHTNADGRRTMVEIPGSEFEMEVDLVLLALGFVHPQREGLLADLGVELDARGNVKASTDSYATSVPGVFACGDMRRGQSLIVWAIAEGREAAHHVDAYLMGTSALPLAGARRF
ncbi:MAG: glutamate synthase subunit beta [Chloroherpetonaceae bacterium]|nr:glutamate synthase subunit beta [Chthonomonadaceae bacterium]MDW8207325.1 glutamate synthase subunit beta [Chloroherpetonaceae bacterium]